MNITYILLAAYFIIIGAVGLFGLVIDEKWLALLALIIGIALLFFGLGVVNWPNRRAQ
jgi:hypothetical protein